MLLASESRQGENIIIRSKPLLDPYPTHQTSTQDPTSEKSQGGGGGSGSPPSESVHAINGFKFIFWTFLLSPHIGFVRTEVYVISKM